MCTNWNQRRFLAVVQHLNLKARVLVYTLTLASSSDIRWLRLSSSSLDSDDASFELTSSSEFSSIPSFGISSLQKVVQLECCYTLRSLVTNIARSIKYCVAILNILKLSR